MEGIIILGLSLVVCIAVWRWYVKLTAKKEAANHKLFLECEKARWEAKEQRLLENEKYKVELEIKRTERMEIFAWSEVCSKQMAAFMQYLPTEDLKDFFLSEEVTAFLPLSIGPYLKNDFLKYLQPTNYDRIRL